MRTPLQDENQIPLERLCGFLEITISELNGGKRRIRDKSDKVTFFGTETECWQWLRLTGRINVRNHRSKA